MTERDVFIAALQKEDPAEACSGRPDLRGQVEGLLRLHEGAGRFLDRPAVESPATGAFQDASERTADFNHDGRLDLATANYGDDTVSVLLGNSQGGFGAANHFVAGSGPVPVAVGDFDHDGNLDLAT